MESEQELRAKLYRCPPSMLQLVVIGRLRRRLGIYKLAPVMRVMLSFFDEVDIVVDDGTREAAML